MEEYDVSETGYVITGNFLSVDANTFTVTFPDGPGSDNIAWVEDQFGNILFFTVSLSPRPEWA